MPQLNQSSGQSGSAAKTGKQAAAPAKPYPFPVGVYESLVADYDMTITPAATVANWTSPQLAPLWNVSPTGWLRGCWMKFDLTVTGGGTTATYTNDGPWGLVQKFTIYDLGSEVILQVTGYEWMILNKFGGYFAMGDPRADLSYLAANTGNISFTLYAPFEVVARDALGTVQNESKPGWKLEVYIDTAQNTYGLSAALPTSTATLSLRVRGYPNSYTEPASAAPNGRPYSQTPPLPGSLQYWKSENLALPSGSAKYDLVNGIGFPIRNVIYYARASDTTRATADASWPDPGTLLIGNVNYFTRAKSLWISMLSKDFGMGNYGSIAPGVDSANGRENSVFPFWLTKDMNLEPGAELRFKYIDTQVNSLVRYTGSFGAALTFYALVNWIATPSRNRYALIAGS
jgi:hypothetical protein